MILIKLCIDQLGFIKSHYNSGIKVSHTVTIDEAKKPAVSLKCIPRKVSRFLVIYSGIDTLLTSEHYRKCEKRLPP